MLIKEYILLDTKTDYCFNTIQASPLPSPSSPEGEDKKGEGVLKIKFVSSVLSLAFIRQFQIES